MLLLAECKPTTTPAEKSAALKDTSAKRTSDTVAPSPVKIDTNAVQPATSVKNELSFLADLNGQYPYQVKLLNNPVLKRRLTKMLGSRFQFLKSIWNVETPIEINNNLFYAWAMQTHSGGDPSAVIMADLSKNVLYVGIRENGKTKIYSEDRTEAPQKLKDWSKEN